MRRYRNSKVVATLGPASSSWEMIERLLLAGVDVFRLNFSHGSYDAHAAVYSNIRQVGKKHHHNTTILADLQGPKLRIGVFENDKIILDKGDILRFDLDSTPGNTQRVNLPHPEILDALQVGATLLLDDGKLRFEVVSCHSDFVEAKVLVGGALSNRKGINVPQNKIPLPALTMKDRQDLEFALKLGVDWVALSFVQTVADVEEAKQLINGKAKVLSKIEKPVAVEEIEPITYASDGIMVARGDLGVEMLPEEVPAAQRLIINTSHRLGKPVIVATQMLESMISSPTPTRAEVSDVAYAIYSGADAVMLSAESAAGSYPVEAVQMMSRIVTKAEQDPTNQRRLEDSTQQPQCTVLDSKCKAAKDLAQYSFAKCIVMFSDSFLAVSRCARLRPTCPIILATSSDELAHQAGIFCGVSSFIVKKEFDFERIRSSAITLVGENQFAQAGDNIVVLSDFDENFLEVVKI